MRVENYQCVYSKQWKKSRPTFAPTDLPNPRSGGAFSYGFVRIPAQDYLS
jgi:hypothetical protein